MKKAILGKKLGMTQVFTNEGLVVPVNAKLGLFKKTNIEPKKYVREFRLDNAESYNVGDKVECSVFEEGDVVDITGTSKGHGTSGTIKKWNFQRHRMSHGNGPNHRHPGSIGANTFPAKVFKGKKMYGRWGNETVTMQNLKVIKVDLDRNLILVKGAVPGAKGSLVLIKDAVKA